MANKQLIKACNEGDLKLTLSDWNEGLASACLEGYRELALLMIEKGAKDWNRGLSYACREGHRDLASLMIEKGAYINECSPTLANEVIWILVKKGNMKDFGKYEGIAEKFIARKNKIIGATGRLMIPDLAKICFDYC